MFKVIYDNLILFRWLTTANGYLRLLVSKEEVFLEQKEKLHRMASFVLSVNASMFFHINLNPRAPE